jgi:hypothetical protein
LGFGGEGGEVVGANELVGGLVHESKVEWVGIVPTKKAVKRLLGGREAKVVGVVFGAGVKGGVEGWIGEGDVPNADIGGEIAIEGAEELGGGEGLGGGELDHLSLCVDPAVGAAGGFADDGLLEDVRGGFLELFLDRGTRASLLPTEVTGSVVGDEKAVGDQTFGCMKA